MNALLYTFAAIGFLAVAIPTSLVTFFVLCHLLAKAKLHRDARLTALKTQIQL